MTDRTTPSQSLYTLLLDHINDGINVVDATGLLIYVNAVSACYVGLTPEVMTGRPVRDFYPDAALQTVIQTRRPVLNKSVRYPDGRRYLASAYPIFENGRFQGGYSIFKSTDDIEALNRKILFLERQAYGEGVRQCPLVGAEDSLKPVLQQARRTVGAPGGPRHCVITGPSGTGKTALAAYIHDFAVQIGVLDRGAPFVEVNCAQFTSPDMAAMEVFGSERGAFTGALEKQGLFELAHGGILFLDEAHALGPHQTLLLKAIETGRVRRIGGTREHPTRVILIAASTRSLRQVLLPELYQRLAQNELAMPSLDQRTPSEKQALLESFTRAYEEAARRRHQVALEVSFSPEALSALLGRSYPRNIRQFRDAVNGAIDRAAPLISELKPYDCLRVRVDSAHVAHDPHPEACPLPQGPALQPGSGASIPALRVMALRDLGMGPRRIAAQLGREGWQIPYHRIAYYLKKERV